MNQARSWILVTGCSTGIGRAMVPLLRDSGWGVIATARCVETLTTFPVGDDLRCLSLDVTDRKSLAAVVEACSDLRLIALVNNAGYGQMGPLEALRIEELRAQFETNVMGLQAVTNALLPAIRRNAEPGEGRVVQVASVLGRLSIPMAGAYNASKHAVVALAETLRLEIGREISVILVEPGAIKTEFRNTLVSAWGDLPERVKGTKYESTVEHYRRKRESFAEEHGMTSQECAAKIVRALNARHPPRRLVIGADSYWAQVAHTFLPAALFEWILRRSYKV